QPVAAGLVFALAVYGGLTIRRNSDWRDPLTLYEATVRLAPQSARAWSNLGHAYQDTGQTQKAMDAYQHALQITEGASDVSPGGTQRNAASGESERAMASHQRALVANIYREQGRYADAAREFDAALALDATNVSAYNNLALTLEALGRTEDAKQAFET